MRSGIGPAGQLQEFGIDVVRDAARSPQPAGTCELRLAVPGRRADLEHDDAPLSMMREMLRYR